MDKTKKTIIDNIKDLNVNNMNRTAFESLGGNEIDFKTFFEMTDVYAKGFKELGVDSGDIVTICSAGTLDTVLNFAGLNKIGAVAQFVNPNYFKYNSKKYINDNNSKLLVCLDRFYPLIKDAIGETNVEKVMLSSISEYSSFLYKVLAGRKKVKDADKIEGVSYIDLPHFIKMGRNSNMKIERLPYEENKPSVITYTSGTTGNPKGVVHTNDSLNNMLKIYELNNYFGAKTGDRNLVLIPPMYLTSFMHSIYGPMSFGVTSILQPIYNPKTLGKDLKKYEPAAVVASKSHYINLQDAHLPKGSLSATKFAFCGGEAISKSAAIRINEILDYYGIPPMMLAYGQTEFGTMVMINNEIEGRTNESGMLIPGVKAKIVDPLTGKEVKRGERGELLVDSPAVMKEYLHNEEATNKFFVFDDKGEKWARTGDIAEIKGKQNGRDVYEVSGRKSDSFIDEKGEVVYLFDIENKVEEADFVNQAEVVALTVDGKKVPVVHIVLDEKAKDLEEETVKLIDTKLKEELTNESSIPYAYKVRDGFGLSPISGKRDYAILVYETDDYYKVDDNGEVYTTKVISEESQKNNDIVKSKILIRK